MEADPVELSKILGVDAVFIVDLEQNKIKQDFEAANYQRSINTIFGENTPSMMAMPTDKIKIKGTLFSGNSGEVFYWMTDKMQASLIRPTSEIVRLVSQKIGFKFPYNMELNE